MSVSCNPEMLKLDTFPTGMLSCLEHIFVESKSMFESNIERESDSEIRKDKIHFPYLPQTFGFAEPHLIHQMTSVWSGCHSRDPLCLSDLRSWNSEPVEIIA